MSGDAHHITAPPDDGAGAVAAMRNALNDAQMAPTRCSTSTRTARPRRKATSRKRAAIKTLFGADTRVAVNSTKSMIGHLLGAAGAVEAIFTALAIRHQVSPPTINLDNPSDDCDLDYVPNDRARHRHRRRACRTRSASAVPTAR